MEWRRRRFLDIEIALSKQALEYFHSGSVWEVPVMDLSDERWATRVWLAGRYLRRLRKHF